MIANRVRAHRMIISYDEHIGHLYVPNSTIRVPHVRYPYLIQTNKQGFRSDFNFIKEKHPDKIRIVFLGDSYTAGQNVDNKHRFSNIIEEELGCECYNFGLAGSGVDQQLLIYERIAREYAHDILIISPHLVDIQRNMQKERVGNDRSTGRKIVIPKPYFTIEDASVSLHNIPVPRPFLVSNSGKEFHQDDPFFASPTFKELFHKWMPTIAKEQILKLYNNQYRGYRSKSTKEWIMMETLITRIINVAKDKTIFLMPLPETRTFLNPRYQNLFLDISEKYDNVTFIDVEKCFNQYPKKKRTQFRFDYGHYTPYGHKVVADVLKEKLGERVDAGKRNQNLPKQPLDAGISIKILGISAFYHDSAASLIIDGKIVAAAHEERFSRRKHDKSFPYQAINYCLEEAKLHINHLDAVVFYDKTGLSLERIVSSHLAVSPKGMELWNDMAMKWMFTNLDLQRIIKADLGFNGKILHTEHHRSHAASAFFPSPFEEAAVLTIDGVGEWATATISHGQGSKLEILKELRYPHSVGLLYSAFTQYAGFKVNSGEYKLMGLAPYGNPLYVEDIKDNIVEIKDDGSIRLNLDFFDFMSNNKSMVSKQFEELFGSPSRESETQITQKDMDIAKSIQLIVEEIMLKMAKHARDLTGCEYLCMAGGVALNCVGNGRLLRESGFEDIWIQPAAGDAGGSLGAALDVHHSYFDRKRELDSKGRSLQRGSFWGPNYSPEEIVSFLGTKDYPNHHLKSGQRSKTIATYLSQGKIIGHFSGRIEFGPRSLGARSILGDARNERTQSILNLKIKYRESFRPFAPTVLEEDIGKYFEINTPSPYMLLVAPVVQQRRLSTSVTPNKNLIDIVNLKRSDIPAVTHVDYSARIQSINGTDHPKYYDLINEFKKQTGYGVIVNTSFNVRGEPIVCTPEDAYRCFMRTDMDLLILEDFLLIKEEQPKFEDEDNWREEFQLD